MLRSNVYKTPRPHEIELPRKDDLAEIRRSHCVAESGLLLQVVGDPHLCYCQCADCGQEVTEYFVEVYSPCAQWWFKTPGPWFYPIDWLKRVDPRDPVQYERVRNYMPLWPTEQQIALANR
ncbi:MAG TPA: hypothetical protein VGF89_01020 [Steroidobacteraceae bacterium]